MAKKIEKLLLQLFEIFTDILEHLLWRRGVYMA